MDEYEELPEYIIEYADALAGRRDQAFIIELRALDRLMQRAGKVRTRTCQNNGGRLRSRQIITQLYMDFEFRKDMGSPYGLEYVELSE